MEDGVNLPVGEAAPEGGRKELYEGPGSDEEAALPRVHTHLLEIDTHQGEEGSECRVKEEVEGLDGKELLVDGTA